MPKIKLIKNTKHKQTITKDGNISIEESQAISQNKANCLKTISRDVHDKLDELTKVRSMRNTSQQHQNKANTKENINSTENASICKNEIISQTKNLLLK